jgi:hypothetical protein
MGEPARRTRGDVQGETVAVDLTPQQRSRVDALEAIVGGTTSLTGADLVARRRLPFRTLGYDPRAADNLAAIQKSAVALTPAELSTLGAHGFVISDRNRYPHFALGYKTIYSQDLPVFISADSILQAVHQSYEAILTGIELSALQPELQALLTDMRQRLPKLAGADAATRADVDVFLAVALGLLQDSPAGAVAGGADDTIATLINGAKAASGETNIELFGVKRDVDFSQFEPRGHYAGIPTLAQYFRAMMWLGRIDFPMLWTDPETGERVLIRRSVAAAFALRALLDEPSLARWRDIDQVLRAMVGEPDSMSPPDVDRLKADLGVTGNDVSGVSSAALARALVAGAYGEQKILSQIVLQNQHQKTWPLDATFLFMGQRYVFDAHVMSNVVYDRVVNDDPNKVRMMPSPLDVAYAALGNDQAVGLLAPELDAHPYAPALERMRLLGDQHGDAFWQANVYNAWVAALRALSPAGDLDRAVPAVAGTEAWGRRVLSTQLASWAELRHDTILYAKQSYTGGAVCSFPDAYVEPRPAFFAALEKLAAAGAAMATRLPPQSSAFVAMDPGPYFQRLGQVATLLRQIAEAELAGTPLSADQLAFINRAVSVKPFGCGGTRVEGWYADLFFSIDDASKSDPTIADVHTQPTDFLGNFVGRVLHAGTGFPRLMVMTVDGCGGPRAYAGVVSAYHELVTENLERLTDWDWSRRVGATDGRPDEVPWMSDLVVK